MTQIAVGSVRHDDGVTKLDVLGNGTAAADLQIVGMTTDSKNSHALGTSFHKKLTVITDGCI